MQDFPARSAVIASTLFRRRSGLRLTRNVPVITIPPACPLSSEPTIRERVLTIHGIESSGDWQEDIARAFAPHFECKTIKYPHYRWVGPLKLLLEPYVFLVLGVICAGVLFRANHSSRTAWLALPMLFFIPYLPTSFLPRCPFHHFLPHLLTSP